MKPIKWSKWARRDLENTTSYWNEHNQSSYYSRRLAGEVLTEAAAISLHSKIGAETAQPNIFKKIVADHFLIIYRVMPNHITILRFWDTRRNPRKLKRYFK